LGGGNLLRIGGKREKGKGFAKGGKKKTSSPGMKTDTEEVSVIFTNQGTSSAETEEGEVSGACLHNKVKEKKSRGKKVPSFRWGSIIKELEKVQGGKSLKGAHRKTHRDTPTASMKG